MRAARVTGKGGGIAGLFTSPELFFTLLDEYRRTAIGNSLYEEGPSQSAESEQSEVRMRLRADGSNG